VVACEPETGAPLAASLAAGKPVAVDYRPSFVDGAGSKALLPAMWERARSLVAAAVAVPLDDAASAVRLLATRAHVVAEGAGALPLAGAIAGHGGTGRVVCIVSGGNIDPDRLAAILAGDPVA
jgi:threonine dehydratase